MTYIISTTDSELIVLEKILNSINNTIKTIVCFNACDELFIENIVKKFPWIIGALNKKNKESFPSSINSGIRYAHQIFKDDVCVLLLDKDFKTFQGKNKYDVDFNESFLYISKEVLDKVGYFNSVFKTKFYLLDYLLRAKTADFSFSLSDNLLSQELENASESLETVQFGTQWAISENIAPQEFWAYLLKTKYEWSNFMRIP